MKAEDVRSMCEGKLEDGQGRIEIGEIGDPLYFPEENLHLSMHCTKRM